MTTRALSPRTIVATALALADEGGTRAASMRRVAERLGVEAMSLYHHVPSKDAMLAAMVDAVFGEIERPPRGAWRSALRRRCESLRRVLLAHPWAISVLESRRHPGPEALAHHEWVLSRLGGAGFSVAMAAHAFSLLDSYVYGFVLQELSQPIEADEVPAEIAASFLEALPERALPHLREVATAYGREPRQVQDRFFAFGLDLILDGLAARRARRR